MRAVGEERKLYFAPKRPQPPVFPDEIPASIGHYQNTPSMRNEVMLDCHLD